jgi:hypothetical protein
MSETFFILHCLYWLAGKAGAIACYDIKGKFCATPG